VLLPLLLLRVLHVCQPRLLVVLRCQVLLECCDLLLQMYLLLLLLLLLLQCTRDQL
jgi:hypothetical protein